MGLLLSCRHPDLLSDCFDVVQHLVVPKAQDAKTGLRQSPCADFVLLCLVSVVPTVYLDDQLVLQAHEIEDVITERVLPPELQP